jgi:hypothetical protein
MPGFQGIDFVYSECGQCGSLQTQRPTWLNAAYAQSNLTNADVGAAQRVLINFALVLVLTKILRIESILDFGGGDGLLCRLLRDRGLEAQTIDEHAKPTYCQPFQGELSNYYDLVTAFEVFEHLPRPSQINELFERRPRYVLASTEVYSGQGPAWWYLCPLQGQHVFFYSKNALEILAKRQGYTYYAIGGKHLFARDQIHWARRLALSVATSELVFRFFRASLPFTETWSWIQEDFKSVQSMAALHRNRRS